MNLPAIAPDALPNHASSQQPEVVLVFLWIQGALLLPLRDTQLGILHCPWWFLLGHDLMVVRSSPLPLQTAMLHPPLLRFSSPPTRTHTRKHTTLPVPAKIKLRKN